jgi:hypothetical protein
MKFIVVLSNQSHTINVYVCFEMKKLNVNVQQKVF